MEQLRLVIHRDLEQCATIEEVKRMLEEKDREIRTFLGHVVKRVPRPHRIAVKRKYFGARKKVELIFKCPRTGVEVTVKSHSWSLWLKFAFALVQAGRSVVEVDIEGAVENGIAALQEAYKAINEKNEDRNHFGMLMRAPLLLSTEQDELVGGLRSEGFFVPEGQFDYNEQTGEWWIPPLLPSVPPPAPPPV